MAIQKKNLLEAFQASAAAEKELERASGTPTTSKAAGPFAAAESAPPPEAPRLAPAAGEQRGTAWVQESTTRLVVLVTVLIVAAFFVGRASVGRVEAGASSSSAPTTGRVVEPRPSRPSSTSQAEPASSVQAQTPAERALLDPRNRYTVKLVEYKKGRDDEIAMQTLAWLQGQKLPAVAQFQGARLYILLGAAEKQSGLDDLLAQAKSMNGPPPQNRQAEFHDAYVVSIDRLIQR